MKKKLLSFLIAGVMIFGVMPAAAFAADPAAVTYTFDKGSMTVFYEDESEVIHDVASGDTVAEGTLLTFSPNYVRDEGETYNWSVTPEGTSYTEIDGGTAITISMPGEALNVDVTVKAAPASYKLTWSGNGYIDYASYTQDGTEQYIYNSGAEIPAGTVLTVYGDLYEFETPEWDITSPEGLDFTRTDDGESITFTMPESDVNVQLNTTIDGNPLTYGDELYAFFSWDGSSATSNPDEDGMVPEGASVWVCIKDEFLDQLPDDAQLEWIVTGLEKTELGEDDYLTPQDEGKYIEVFDTTSLDFATHIEFYMPDNAVDVRIKIKGAVTLTLVGCAAYVPGEESYYGTTYEEDDTPVIVPAGKNIEAWGYLYDEENDHYIYPVPGDKVEWTITNEAGETIIPNNFEEEEYDHDIYFTMPDESITVTCVFEPATLEDVLIDMGTREFTVKKAADGSDDTTKGIIEIDDMVDYYALINTLKIDGQNTMLAAENSIENENDEKFAISSYVMDGFGFIAGDASNTFFALDYEDEEEDATYSVEIGNIGAAGQAYYNPLERRIPVYPQSAAEQPLEVQRNAIDEDLPDIFARFIRTPLLKSAMTIQPDISGLIIYFPDMEVASYYYYDYYRVGIMYEVSYTSGGQEYTYDEFGDYRLYPIFPELEEDIIGEEAVSLDDYDYPVYPYYSKVVFTPADDIIDDQVIDLYNEDGLNTIYGEDAVKAAVLAVATALTYEDYNTDDEGNYVFDETQLENGFFKLDLDEMKIYFNLDYDEEQALEAQAEGDEDEAEVSYDVSVDFSTCVDTVSDKIDEVEEYMESEGEDEVPDVLSAYTDLKLVFAKEDTCSINAPSYTIYFPEKGDVNVELIDQFVDTMFGDSTMGTTIKEIIGKEFGGSDMSTQSALAAGASGAGIYDAVKALSLNSLTFILNATPVVTFDGNGGRPEYEEAQTNNEYKLDKLPRAMYAGYIFKGWFTEPEGGEKITTDTIFEEDTTVYAQWTKPSGGGGGSRLYIVHFETNGGTEIYPVSYAPDSIIDPSEFVTTKTGDTFLGWYRDELFTRPADAPFRLESDVTLYAKWKSDEKTPPAQPQNPPVEEKSPFSDITPNDWFYEDVVEMFEKGYISGIGDGKFGPNLSTERGMIVTILYRMEGSPKVEYKELYSDVPEGKWYTDAVIWATSEDIAAGYPEGDFKPDQIVSRQELARFIYQYACYKGSGFDGLWEFKLDFDDANRVGSWAKESVQWCVMNKILSGVGNNMLAPRETATRAQLAAMLNRLSKMDLTPAPVEYDETEEEPPAEEPPAEEAPAEEPPVEETPAEEPPVEETPAEETPAEEVAVG